LVLGTVRAGDIVTDLHQLTVATAHAAIAAMAIHDRLPRNLRYASGAFIGVLRAAWVSFD
jgi:hypothetical protein